jgi:hypothetical protein
MPCERGSDVGGHADVVPACHAAAVDVCDGTAT